MKDKLTPANTHTHTHHIGLAYLFSNEIRFSAGFYSRRDSYDHSHWKGERTERAVGEGEEDKALLRSRDGEAALSRWLLDITPTTYRWEGLAETEGWIYKMRRSSKYTVLSLYSIFFLSPAARIEMHGSPISERVSRTGNLGTGLHHSNSKLTVWPLSPFSLLSQTL